MAQLNKVFAIIVLSFFILTTISYAKDSAESGTASVSQSVTASSSSAGVASSAGTNPSYSCNLDLCRKYVCCELSKGPCSEAFPQECASCTKDICASSRPILTSPITSAINERQMIERFQKGEMSEDQMRAMVKAKMGDKFSEMDFQRVLIEAKKIMNRKDAVSYENQGYNKPYDAGPSYEGYSPEQIIFSRVFQLVGNDIDPREIKQYCSNTSKIADMVIGKLKEKVGDLQKICDDFESHGAQCAETAQKDCSKIGTPMIKEGATEMQKLESVAYACPVNKDAIIEACNKRNEFYIERNMKNVDESCQKRFDVQGDRLIKECERFKQSQKCDKDKFISQCMSGVNQEHMGENGQNQNTCPTQSVPSCKDTETLQKKVGERGCVYYYCATSSTTNECGTPDCGPQPSMPNNLCPDGKTTAGPTGRCLRHSDGKCGWEIVSCPSTACSKPICDGVYDTGSKDANGCEIYACPTSNATSITGNAALTTSDEFMKHCETSWEDQQRICSGMQERCDKSSFIEKCKEQERKNNEDMQLKTGHTCQSNIDSQINAVQERCSRIEEEKKHCLDEKTKRCSQMQGLQQKCTDTLTEENLRKFIIEEATKRCKFAGILKNEDEIRRSDKVEIILAVLNTATEDDLSKLKVYVDNLHEDLKLQDTTIYKGTIDPNRFWDIKLMPFVVNAKISTATSSEISKQVKESIVAGQKAEDAAGKLASLRDSDIPSEYLYIIEDKASDVLNVSDKLDELQKKDEQKGVGYKIKLFFGLAKKAEQDEISQLEESKSKLSSSIDALAKLVDGIPSDVAKAVLKEQVESLKKQQQEIDALIKAKQKKAKGLFGIFG